MTISGIAFVISSLWDYRRPKPSIWSLWNSKNDEIYIHFWNYVLVFKESFGPIYAIVGLNLIIFLAWQVPSYHSSMVKHFVSTPLKKSPIYTMLTCIFSHSNPLHLFFNVFAFFQFAPSVAESYGPSDFAFLYISAGLFSVFLSLVGKMVKGVTYGSIGASGAIMGIFALHVLSNPTCHYSIIGLDVMFPHSFSSTQIFNCVCAFETLGLFLKKSPMDHFGHLGGLLFGSYGHFCTLDGTTNTVTRGFENTRRPFLVGLTISEL